MAIRVVTQVMKVVRRRVRDRTSLVVDDVTVAVRLDTLLRIVPRRKRISRMVR